MLRRRWIVPVVVLTVCTACTSTVATTPTTSTLRGPVAVHPSRDALAAALPSVADLTWLPAGTATDRDSDLTDRLVFVGCSAAPHPVASNRDTVTNVAFRDQADRVAVVTYYDVDSIDEAEQFMSGMRAFLRCPNQGASPSTALLPLATPTSCDELLALRTRQPVSATIDAWCRVGNLIGWVRLYPRGEVAPTDADGVATIDTVGTRLGSLFA